MLGNLTLTLTLTLTKVGMMGKLEKRFVVLKQANPNPDSKL